MIKDCQSTIIIFIMKSELSELNKKIALKIKLERTKRNLSQEGLANIANVSRITIGNIERFIASPTIDTLEKIANALNMEFIELVDVSKFDL